MLRDRRDLVLVSALSLFVSLTLATNPAGGASKAVSCRAPIEGSSLRAWVFGGGAVSPRFHARRDGNRVFYASSLAETKAWLPYADEIGPVNFKRYGLLAIFLHNHLKSDVTVTGLRESGNALYIRLGPDACPVLWDPPEWGVAVYAIIDKTTLPARPSHLYVTP